MILTAITCFNPCLSPQAVAIKPRRISPPVNQLGVNVKPARIKQVDVRNLSGAEGREKAARAIAGDESAFQYVHESEDTAKNIYAWLLETGEAGDFDEAVQVFAKAAEIADRLTES